MVRSDLSEIPAYIPGKKLPDALRLASNETSETPLPAVRDAITKAATGLNRYPDMGVDTLRAKLAEWLSTSPGSPELTAENIVVGNGSSALCLQAIQATCVTGDEVIFPWRSFEAYPILTRIAGARPVPVPLTADLRNDLDAILAAVTDRTQLIFVCNPNNPTGTTVSEEELRAFLDAVPQRVQIILDEAYTEYDRSGADGSPSVNGLALLDSYSNVAICRTFSKAYGLAGLRIGYSAGQSEFVSAMAKVAIPFGVNSLAQVAGVASMSAEAQRQLGARVAETVEQRSRVLANLPRELRVPSQTNFVWLPIGERATTLDEDLKAEGVVARCFAGEGVRVTVTTYKEVNQLLPALEKVLTGLAD